MPELDNNWWFPQAEHVEQSNAARLMTEFGVADFEDLRRLSLHDPSAYWRKVNQVCGVVWSRDYDHLVNLADGLEFPRWFVGGELNWVDTILRRADDPVQSTWPAVIAERESGDVATASFAELRNMVRGFAHGLERLGIKAGDRIGLLMETGLEAVVSILAIAHMGAIVVPLFSGFGADPVRSRLSAAGARAIIGSSGFRRRGRLVETGRVLAEAASQLPDVEVLILKGGGPAPSGLRVLDWHDVAVEPPTTSTARRMDPNDPFMIIFTSGTTGKPKGVVHTHGGFPLKVVHDSMIHFEVREGDRFCWPADMGWIAGALFTAAALMRGATMVCYDGAPDFPDWSRMSGLVERHRLTHLGVAPTLIRGLAAHADLATAGDVRSLRTAITSGEAIDPEHFTWFRRAFGHGTAPLINYTGGTEVSGGLLSSVVVKPIGPAGFNTACPGVDVYVAGPDGMPVVGKVGELAIRAPFVGMTKSFWRDRERYLDTYWRTFPHIWVHGDLAVETPNGSFSMRGRSDDTIKVAGKRLGPAEVEELLLELPLVSEAAAIGIDDAVKGQKLVVFLIPTPGVTRDEAALSIAAAEHVEAGLGRAFKPGRVHVVDQLPKTRSSKVMRRVLRAVYCGLPLGDLSSLDNPSSLDEIKRAAETEESL